MITPDKAVCLRHAALIVLFGRGACNREVRSSNLGPPISAGMG